MPRGAGWAAGLESLLARHWWRADRTWLAHLLTPLSWIYGAAAALQRWRARPVRAPVPLCVVGNFVVGGAGKTPVVIALVQALQSAGYRPGVISRGHGRRDAGVAAVSLVADPNTVGDEPLLIHRRTGVPVWVGRQRVRAAQALCAHHPEVNVLVCDDGLQHGALARDADIVVFDARGVGNGLLLPAGPLRAKLPSQLPVNTRVLYARGHVCSALPGFEITRSVRLAWPLQAWWDGDARYALPLATLQGRPLFAVAGVAAPHAFFAMLHRAGLHAQGHAMPDHSRYEELPWPAGTLDVVTTEKDAVKLRRACGGSTRVWVVPLDLELPAALLPELIHLLRSAQSPFTAPEDPP